MYGWRGKLGLIKATSQGPSYEFWYRNVPAGVEIKPTAIGYTKGQRSEFATGPERAEERATQLAADGCTCVMIGGTPPFLLQGPQFELDWQKRVEAALGIPVITPMIPHVLAMRALGLESVAVATYYRQELNDAIVSYLAQCGIRGVVTEGLQQGTQTEELFATPLGSQEALSAAAVYKYCKKVVEDIGGGVDGLYINGGGWEVSPVLNILEDDLELPVVWAQPADLWVCFRRMRIRAANGGHGRLLREW